MFTMPNASIVSHEEAKQRGLNLKYSWKIAIKCCLQIFCIILNSMYIIYNVATFRSKESKHYNKTRAVVVIMEFVVWFYFAAQALFVIFFVPLLGNIGERISLWCCKNTNDSKRHSKAEYRVMAGTFHLKNLASFSLLKYLPSVTRGLSLWKDRHNIITHVHERGRHVIVGYLVRALCILISVPAFLLKYIQVDFIADTYFRDWKMVEFVLFIGFLNQIASIVNEEEVQLEAIFGFIAAGPDGVITDDGQLEKTALKMSTYSGIIAKSPHGSFGYWRSFMWTLALDRILWTVILKNHDASNAQSVSSQQTDVSATHSDVGSQC